MESTKAFSQITMPREVPGPGKITRALAALGITEVRYCVEPLAPRDRVTTIFAFKGLYGTLIDDNPPGWIEGVERELEHSGWTEGWEYLRPTRSEFDALVGLLHPYGWAAERGLRPHELRRTFLTVEGGEALRLAQLARNGVGAAVNQGSLDESY